MRAIARRRRAAGVVRRRAERQNERQGLAAVVVRTATLYRSHAGKRLGAIIVRTEAADRAERRARLRAVVVGAHHAWRMQRNARPKMPAARFCGRRNSSKSREDSRAQEYSTGKHRSFQPRRASHFFSVIGGASGTASGFASAGAGASTDSAGRFHAGGATPGGGKASLHPRSRICHPPPSAR
jgi:hypothetical protein